MRNIFYSKISFNLLANIVPLKLRAMITPFLSIKKVDGILEIPYSSQTDDSKPCNSLTCLHSKPSCSIAFIQSDLASIFCVVSSS